MKDAEPTIERLLAGLREAEPQPGIEHRILEALLARAAAPSVPFWNRLRPQSLFAFALWLASALAVTGAFVAVAFHQSWKVPAGSNHPPTLAVRQESPAQTITQTAAVPAQRATSRIGSKHRRTKTPVPDLRAAGFPAPPLPLTEQEKLLLRVAHRTNPKDAAILNPTAQAAQSARANEQFQQFFGIKATEMRTQIE